MRAGTNRLAGCLVGCLAFWPMALAPAAARAQDLVVCRAIGDASARLACFDAIAAAEAAEVAPRDTTVRSGSVVQPDAPTRYESVDLRRLSHAPARYVNKPLLFQRARCTYADVNDYRCSLADDAAVEIRAPVIVPPPVQTAVEGRCGTLHQDRARPCEGTVRVVPTAIRAEGRVGLVVEAASISMGLALR